MSATCQRPKPNSQQLFTHYTGNTHLSPNIQWLPTSLQACATRLMLQQLMLTDICGGRLHHTDCVMCNTGVGADATVHKENYHISGGKGGKVETRNKTHPESCIFSRCCSICIIMWESLGSCTDVSLKRWENGQNHTSASSTWPSQPQHLVTKAVRWTTS